MIHLRNGAYALVEVKLGGKAGIEHGAATLERLRGKIREDQMGTPSFMMILTGTGRYAYRRKEDGILVVPIGCLKD